MLGDETNLGRGEDDYVDPPGIEYLDNPIKDEEVRKATDHLKLNKSPGPEILAEMLKNSLEHVLSFLVLLINHVFDTGQYPSAWSGAIIVPIHKSGDKDNPDNYRGVSQRPPKRDRSWVSFTIPRLSACAKSSCRTGVSCRHAFRWPRSLADTTDRIQTRH